MIAKIALVIDSEGRYNACGWSSEREIGLNDLLDSAREGLDPSSGIEACYVVEVEVDRPALTRVLGTAKEVPSSE